MSIFRLTGRVLPATIVGFSKEIVPKSVVRWIAAATLVYENRSGRNGSNKWLAFRSSSKSTTSPCLAIAESSEKCPAAIGVRPAPEPFQARFPIRCQLGAISPAFLDRVIGERGTSLQSEIQKRIDRLVRRSFVEAYVFLSRAYQHLPSSRARCNRRPQSRTERSSRLPVLTRAICPHWENRDGERQ